jgi:beta-lactamase regulating signal transducer with metallopeptidase domain
MTAFLIYDLKVALLIAVFYFCYRLLMERDTMHRINRVVLLSALALSLVLPLCVVTLHETVWVETGNFEAPSTGAAVVPQNAETATSAFGDAVSWQHLLAVIVVIGMLLRLFYIVQSYRQLRHLLNNSERHRLDDGIEVAVTDEPIAPFSWMKTIVVNRHDYEEHNPLLLIHERSHIRLHHSYDVVFVELLTVLQWFNPVVWLLSRDLRTVHEYEADEAVLSKGFNTVRYISLLMTKATGMQACVLANGINTSEIKKRIDMMIKRKSPRLSWLKGLYVVPVAALSLAVTAKTVTDYRALPGNEGQERMVYLAENNPGNIPDAYLVSYPAGVKFYNNGKLEKEDGSSEGRKLSFSASRTTMQINGQAFDRNSMPDLPVSALAEIRFDKTSDSHSVVNLLTVTQPADDDPIFDVVEELATYPGGTAAMMEFLMKNVKYPAVAEEWGVQGKVLVQFVVEKDGSITNVRAQQVQDSQGHEIVVVAYKPDMTEEQKKNVDGANAGLQALKDEGVRVVKLMPKWKPGKQRGKVVRTRFHIPVTFRLQ